MQSFIFNAAKRKPMTAEEWKQAQASFAEMPTNVGSGLDAVGRALFSRQRSPFPAAPGGGGLGQRLSGLFGLGAGKGGPY